MKAINMKLAPIVALAALICTAAPATAERYAMLKVSMEERALVALNMDSLRQVNGKWRAWVITGMVLRSHDGPVLMQSLTEFDCVEGRSRTIANKLYDEELNVLDDIGGSDWKYAVPHTTGYHTIQTACKARSDKKIDVVDETVKSIMETFASSLNEQQRKK